jgi:hypothetical protein
MRNIASRSFKVAIYATVALVAVAMAVTIGLEALRPPAERLPFLNFELDLFKAILAGFVVSMLGILIPAVASEARQRFVQRKASRIAYSEAKTGIDYLKLRLAVANLDEAADALQKAHFHKHQAELYDDFPEWLEKRYGAKKTALEWDEEMYGKLFCARQALEENAEAWDRLCPAQRIALLDRALPTKSEIKVERLPCFSPVRAERSPQ